MISMTAILFWGAYCGMTDQVGPVPPVVSILLAAAFVWENRGALPRAQAAGIDQRPSLTRRLFVLLGPLAGALFLLMTAFMIEILPYLFMHWFHPH